MPRAVKCAASECHGIPRGDGLYKESPVVREGSTGVDEGIPDKPSVDGTVTIAETYLASALPLRRVFKYAADGGRKSVEDAAAG